VFSKRQYETNQEYKLFISDLTGYTKIGDNKNKKDAIDVMCGAASLMKIKYGKIIYG
jgi:predicted FMN-binding regulatory protein PaiB